MMRSVAPVVPRGSALVLGAVIWAMAFAMPARPAQAQDALQRDGLVITVPTPITDEAIRQIQRKVSDAIERKKRVITTVVFDFNPNGQPATTIGFGAPNDLAAYILNLRLGRVKDIYP